MRQEVRKKEANRQKLDYLLLSAKAGDEEARETLLQDYSPFILRVAALASQKYINPEIDDEYSVALIAFNEAIDSFRPIKNKSFLSFADMVIRRRMVDFYRRQRHMEKEIVMSGFQSGDGEEDEDEEPGLVIKGSQDQYLQDVESSERKLEIEDFKRVLGRYGINLVQLVELSPKHYDTRETLFRMAEAIINHRPAAEAVLMKGTLPYKWLSEKFGLTRKTLRRHKKFLIALCLIKSGDFPYLCSYLKKEKGR